MALRYVEHPPAPALAPFVECFWVVRDAHRRDHRLPDRILPDGCPEWIVHAADPFARRSDGRWRKQPRSFIAGTLSQPWWVQAGREVRTLGIRFRPGAMAALSGASMWGTSDREIAPAVFLGAAARRLPTAVRAQRTTSAMIRAAETELLRIAGPRLGERPLTAPAVRILVRSRGRERIDAVAGALGWTRRRLERAFRRELGIAPKLYARIVRLNAALATMHGPERVRAVEVAIDAGYFDQAHLLHDFRLLAARPPAAGPKADGPLARHFTRPARLRKLLDGE